jgi:hypothetical protein
MFREKHWANFSSSSNRPKWKLQWKHKLKVTSDSIWHVLSFFLSIQIHPGHFVET